ncbi:MAG TPA: Asp-tRNA(Asn)/Glu-tRNA(Gln) amidotransferase GatCAB subunit B [Anaerolineaceae bacterium]|nr:MAG: glutaminyl-tRNA synthase (glutamine-hydrolyzing) subunit B [Chloroflexi bacterium GWB2_54_36]HAL17011.1 Asp-tRNA(Asn)/Glu-tRNA(Gln) amidotransferase GatCAB subunit B [Anaerolineaceae bacterium]
MNDYETVIGLETHIQLNTTTKIFCACKADSWFDPPNTNICPVCTGMPGVLPVLNKAAVEKGVVLAAAMHAEVRPLSYFDRKNYFYPDLPKGYQISQYDQSLAFGGSLDLPVPAANGQPAYIRKVSIHKLHLEEDAGKTKNAGHERLIDFNRCGVPLVEMVTGPDLRSADEAAQYLIRLRQLLRWLGVSEADMEKGHLRCDANVSIRPRGATHLNPKTEIKNVNSIEAVRSAIEKEIERQIREVEAGHRIEAWTLEWDEEAGVLRKMRSKETEADYRYFREPDLLPIRLDDAWKADILKELPELPLVRRQRFMDAYGLPEYDADILTNERNLSDYFESVVKVYGSDPKRVSNYLMNDVLRMLNENSKTADQLRLTPSYLAEIIKLADVGTVNTSTAKSLLQKVEESGKAPGEIVAAEGLAKVSDDSAIRAVCLEVLAESPKEVESYKAGKVTLIGWFVGQVMKKMRGKADPTLARTILEELLA